MRPKTALTRLPLTLIAGIAVAGLAAGPAVAADVPVSLSCQATPPIGSAQTFTLDAGVDGTAPDSVAAGSDFTVTLAPDALTVPGSVSGDTVNSIRNIQLMIPVPAGATLTGETLSGGSGIGTDATVAVSGSDIVVTVPDSVAGGSTFTLPTLTLALTAGASGGIVQTQIAGTGYSDPGLTFTANVTASIFTVDVPTTCYAPSNPVLTSTTVA